MLHLQHSGFVFVIFGKYQNYFFFGLVLLYKKRLIFCEAVFSKGSSIISTRLICEALLSLAFNSLVKCCFHSVYFSTTDRQKIDLAKREAI